MRSPVLRSLTRTRRALCVIVTAAVVAVTGITTATAPAAYAAVTQVDAVQAPAAAPASVSFTAGNIIDNATFYDWDTMTAGQIQTFLNSQVASCRSGFTCLKDYRQSTVNRPADSYCKAYAGSANETAAQIIAKVSAACGINPRVLIVMLQKEQGLVTHTWPSQWRYDSALGQSCPDTPAGCDPAFKGFFLQMYGGARQMKVYQLSGYFSWYPVGKTSNVLFQDARVSSTCGSAPVLIQNIATASLYYYTPYQPNKAALAAGYGEGDICSAYGNRNFYNYFTDWFGTTYAPTSFTTAPNPTISGSTSITGIITAKSGPYSPPAEKIAYQWKRDGVAISGATAGTYKNTIADAGKKLSVTVTASRTGLKSVSTTSATMSIPATTVTRLAGDDREKTAIEVSKKAYPSGAKTVLLATSGNYADALSASAVAAKLGASLLLTNSTSLSASVSAELKRLGATKVYVIGGGSAVPTRVVDAARKALPRASFTRVGGSDRYETSRNVASLIGSASSVYVATGRDFPDALTAASIAGSRGLPVLLVDGLGTGIDAPTKALLGKLGANRLVFVGGAGVISMQVTASFRTAGYQIQRFSGANRYETNYNANLSRYPSATLKVMLATGADFPDALAGSVLAARTPMPLLLTPQNCVATGAYSFMNRRGTNNVTLVGGTGVLSTDVARLTSC